MWVILAVLGGIFALALWRTMQIRQGILLIRQHRYAEARAIFQKMLQADPKSVALMINISVTYYREGNTDAALKILDKAIEQNPNLAISYNNRGWCYAIAGDLGASLEDLEYALELNPKLPSAHDSLGHTLFLMGDYDEALASYTHALQLRANNSSSLAGQALCYHAIGKTGEAKTLWRQLITMDARYASAETLMLDHHPAEAFVDAARELVADLNGSVGS